MGGGLQQAPWYALLDDECTDMAPSEKMSIFCHWVEDGLPVEHFIDIVSLKSTDAESIFNRISEAKKHHISSNSGHRV